MAELRTDLERESEREREREREREGEENEALFPFLFACSFVVPNPL